MFESLEDGEVIAMIEERTRASAMADARRLRAIAEFVGRRVADDDERVHWACDFWDAAAAEIAAAMGIGHRAASREMRIALALAHRLPKVAALYDRGLLSSRLVSNITWRTDLVEDDEALRLLDDALAERAEKWGRLSKGELEHTIDMLIDRYDPGALRRTRSAARGRDICLGKDDDVSGTTSLWGRLFATDAAALKKRLAQLAGGVCEDDPRTMGQRRADALGVLAVGGDRLVCQCGNPECPAAGVDPRAANTTVYVIADQAALDAKPDPCMSGDDDVVVTESLDAQPAKPASALIVGSGTVPTSLLAEFIQGGATVRDMVTPGGEPEPRYRPSAKLVAFVRMRDMRCMFPGCDRLAEFCDVDHTVPYPAGVTHPSNTKSLCRTHHLVKTFWGWRDTQLPDGTVVWNTPSGKTYTSHPASRLLFPHWNTTTARLPQPQVMAPSTTDRGAMMPRRRQTRAAQRAKHLKAERALNDTYVAHRNKPPPARE